MNEKESGNRLIRFIICNILSFLLAVLLATGTFLVGIYVGFMNEGRITDSLIYSDYYTNAEAYFYQKAVDISMLTGLSETVVENIVDSGTVYEDIREYVTATIKGKEYAFQTEELERRLTENVNHYFEAEGLQLTEEQLRTLPGYTQLIADNYEEALKVPFVDSITKLKVTYQKVLIISMPVCIITSGIIIYSYIRMYRRRHEGLRFIIYATLAAACMVAIPCVAVLASGFYKRLNISSGYVYQAFVKYIEDGFLALLYMAAGWFVVSLGLFVLGHLGTRFVTREENEIIKE